MILMANIAVLLSLIIGFNSVFTVRNPEVPCNFSGAASQPTMPVTTGQISAPHPNKNIPRNSDSSEPLLNVLIDASNGNHDTNYDALVVIAEERISDERYLQTFGFVNQALEDLFQIDTTSRRLPSLTRLLVGNPFNITRLVFSPVGSLMTEVDDVRQYGEAAYLGIKRALDAGSRSLLVYVDVSREIQEDPKYELAVLVSMLGALKRLYVPLEVREMSGINYPKADLKTFHGLNPSLVKVATALEEGRVVARDIAASDPERMSPPRAVEYIRSIFKEDPLINMTVIEDQEILKSEFPLLAAVNRGTISRHQGRVVFLEYIGEGVINETVLLVGKGITFDSGGIDLKARGKMLGMHRDKGGAAAVAGFFKILSLLRPKGIKVIGALALVRNGISGDAYVSGEITTSRAGVRVRVGNTDAEGRMVLSDLLCFMKERVIKENPPNPQIYTVATLTGHVMKAFGPAYSAVLDNGPAAKIGSARALFDLGALIGEPVEVSTIRREDYEVMRSKSVYQDIVQAVANQATKEIRGHQYPVAFMIMASGMDEHGTNSEQPIPYTHIDNSASAGKFPEFATGTPLLSLAAKHVLPRIRHDQ